MATSANTKKKDNTTRQMRYNANKTVVKELPNIVETEKFVRRTIKGQDEQVRQILTATYKSIYFGTKSNVLIVGKSGTGKTETLKQLSYKIGRPCIIIDANDYTEEGYQGKNVSDIVWDLLDAVNYDIDKVENSIIIIDEIDKKAQVKDSEHRDVSGKGVQDALLKLIEGKEYSITSITNEGLETIKIRTDKILFFFAGAFSGIDEIIKRRLRKEMSIGFKTELKSEEQIQEERKIKKKDLIEFGLSEEFIGRIDTIVQMNQLTEAVLIDIIQNSRKSKFKLYINNLKKIGIDTVYTKKNIEEFAKKATRESQETGAREIANVVNYVFDKALYQIMAEPKETYSELTLEEGIEEDNTRYSLK